MWNQRYAEPGWAYGTEPNDFLRDNAGELPRAGRVLCLAEGEGRNAVFLAEQGHAVTAVDLSDVGLRKAEALAADRGVTVETVVADLAEHDLGVEAWDGIVAIWCHLPAPVRRTVLRRVVRALKPGGVLILEAYTPRQLAFESGGPKDAAMLYEPADLRADLDGLAFDRCDELERDIQEGKYHQGRSAVVQVLARRP